MALKFASKALATYHDRSLQTAYYSCTQALRSELLSCRELTLHTMQISLHCALQHARHAAEICLPGRLPH